MDTLDQRPRWPYATVAVLAAAILSFCSLQVAASTEFSDGKASFSVKFKEEVSPYRVCAVFALPGELLTIEATASDTNAQYILKVSSGVATRANARRWQWQAPPREGLYPASIIHIPSNDSVVLNIFVMLPYDRLEGEYLNGYRIGKYPSIPLKQLPIYKPPRGFVEVTRENEETFVSPHFRLKQFVCKQQGDYPKYLVLKERLILKLELILEQVNKSGYAANTFNILSGYRTPYYNSAIGNVKYSRHMWGGAADIFIDERPRDDMMDDLNSDGKIDRKDAAVLYDIVDVLYDRHWYSRFLGGLGRYEKTPSHGPFVHVDVRGFRARWGD